MRRGFLKPDGTLSLDVSLWGTLPRGGFGYVEGVAEVAVCSVVFAISFMVPRSKAWQRFAERQADIPERRRFSASDRGK
jgi:hypothetical protein